ncbi:MAG: glycoside hydrolase family 15 protein [Acidobacteria bacterium]|nr:glycoside hydrolase family 15 protein [Acidobacteriota bacterium]
MRDIPIGNGSLLINFDDAFNIRDIYFPHVGQENQTDGHPSRFGIWVDGAFSWLSSEEWTRDLRYQHETLVTHVRLVNASLGIEIVCNDTVASHQNIFLRKITIINKQPEDREIRLFFHHDLRIYGSKVGDTAYYDPETRSVIHYKKHRYFLINTQPHFAEFATGRKDFNGQEGTWRDAEDGRLSGSVVTEGSADSTVSVHLSVDADGEAEAFYWIAAGTCYQDAASLNEYVLKRQPAEFMNYTANYWRAWVNKNDRPLEPLPQQIIDLYKRSLLLVHTHIDNGGAILAGNDWDVTLRATDHYSYLWTRDGAFIAHALDKAGFSHLTRKFFDFCSRVIHPNGYFLQKYNPDGTVASGWHPAWNRDAGQPLVPIQEDETALVLWALWEHYDQHRDIEFANRMYEKVTVPSAEFMADFIHPELGLPKPSWNLWEDRRGIHTFTCASVVAGLNAAAKFAELFAQKERTEKYSAAADSIRNAMAKHLYSPELGRFYRSLQANGDDQLTPDATVDASCFALFYLGCFAPDDQMVQGTMSAIETKLAVNGGVARFENDGYMRVTDKVTGNAWFICTLWLAEYYIASAKSLGDLEKAERILLWITDLALPSGVLGEQIDPVTGAPVSLSPLAWSHSTFVATTLSYLNKLREFS